MNLFGFGFGTRVAINSGGEVVLVPVRLPPGGFRKGPVDFSGSARL
jgi:hypothetical protein